MSTSAGRVLIIPKGEYDSTATYNMLDVVYDQNGSFICKKTSTGNAPDAEQDTEYWQRLAIPSNDVGDLSDLNTTAKSSAVAAINEVLGDIGTLSNLETTTKSSIVAAINEIVESYIPIVITANNVSSLPVTVNNSAIKADMEIIQYYLSSESAYIKTSGISISNGSITLSGTISGTTNIVMILQKVKTPS